MSLLRSHLAITSSRLDGVVSVRFTDFLAQSGDSRSFFLRALEHSRDRVTDFTLRLHREHTVAERREALQSLAEDFNQLISGRRFVTAYREGTLSLSLEFEDGLDCSPVYLV